MKDKMIILDEENFFKKSTLVLTNFSLRKNLTHQKQPLSNIDLTIPERLIRTQNKDWTGLNLSKFNVW